MSQRTMRARFVTALPLALGCLEPGCASGQLRLTRFSTDWTDDRGASIGRVWDRVGQIPIAASADVVVGVAGHSDKLVGLPLSGGAKWTFAHPIEERPVITGGVVVGSGAGETFALDATTGGVIWRRPTGDIPMLGAGDNGSVTVVTFKRSGGTGSTLLAVTHEGQVVQQIETDKALGTPAVIGRLAFVPWAGQYVSAVDLASGDEVARATLREQVSHAWTQSGSLWFGQAAFVRLDAHIRDASKGEATKTTLPARDLPGGPVIMRPGSEPVMAIADASDRVRLYARPEGSDDGVIIADHAWYATYFRLAMGFGQRDAKLKWVFCDASNFIGGAAASGALVLCDEQGKISTLDAQDGALLAEADMGEPVRACVVSADVEGRRGQKKTTKPLSQQLAEAVTLDDARLVSAQKLLLRELSATSDDTATKALVDLASDPRTSPDLLPAARDGLAQRRTGAQYLEAALARHYDYLKDVLRPPPVGPVAQALGAMKDKGAATVLASHLLDPADSEDDVKRVAAALAVVASPEQRPVLRQFFAMYRARAPDDDLTAAVVSTGQALLSIDDRPWIVALTSDNMTLPAVQEPLERLLNATPPEQDGGGAGLKKNKP